MICKEICFQDIISMNNLKNLKYEKRSKNTGKCKDRIKKTRG